MFCVQGGVCDGGGGAEVMVIVLKRGGCWDRWGGIRFALQSDSDLAVKFKELIFF